MIHIKNNRILIAIICFLFYNHIWSQLVNVESQRIQSDSIRFVLNADLSYTNQKNNNEKLSIFTSSVALQIKTKSLKDIFLALFNIDYSEANNQQLSNSVMIHLRYNRKINNQFRLEAFCQYQKNQLLGINYRNLVGLGPRIKLLKHKKSKLYYGLLYMYEKEMTIDENNSVRTNNLNRASTYLSASIKLPKDIGEFDIVSYYQPCLNNFDNYRLNNQGSLIFNITNHIKFTNTISLFFDASPPIGISKNNLNFTNGLKIIY
jgi:hypothetical protein